MHFTINYLYYYFLEKLDNLLGTTFSKPFFIGLIITSRCNSSCKMCPIPRISFKKDMSTNQIKKLITDLKRWLGPFVLTFTGGEPILRKDIWEIISFANNLNIKTLLCTNGTLITKKNIPLLINSGLNDMWISLDSLNPKTYKKIRGKDFNKRVLQTISLLKKYTKNISISINTVITKHNINELSELVEFVKQKRLNSISLIPLMPEKWSSDARKELSYLWPDSKKVETAINQIISYKKKGYPISNPITHLELIKRYYKNPNSINEKCRATSLLFINSRGNAKICQNQLGNMLDKPSKEIWNSKESILLRKKLSKCRKNCAAFTCVNRTYNSLMNKIKQFKRINTFQ